jgi:hypothetical protein
VIMVHQMAAAFQNPVISRITGDLGSRCARRPGTE